MMSSRWILGVCALSCLPALASCVEQGPDLSKDQLYEQALDELALDHELEDQAGIDLVLAPNEARGSFTHEGTQVRFSTRVTADSVETEITLRGMTLLSTIDRVTGGFDVDGFVTDSGEDTQMTDADRAVLRALEGALGDPVRARGEELPALSFLNRAIAVWGEYSSTLPLERAFYGRLDQSASMCSSVNRKGAWGVFVAATHDCNSTAGDCSNWFGCSRWDDNASSDSVFMSMHPDGGCADETYFGNSATTFSCHEPSHPGNEEYAYGGCFGRCGAGCGGGTAFTRACLDHDQCVRLGHDVASFWCDDELTGAAWDMTWASNCSGVTFTVDYNWAGTGTEGNCPTSWNNANDGCDHGCQFIDADCAR